MVFVLDLILLKRARNARACAAENRLALKDQRLGFCQALSVGHLCRFYAAGLLSAVIRANPSGEGFRR
jgi:hypothetical protein